MRQAVRLGHEKKEEWDRKGGRVTDGCLTAGQRYGEKRDPMISNPALISVYIFVPHGTKGAESNA